MPYLLPFGNALAMQLRQLKLNETGAFIFEALQKQCSKPISPKYPDLCRRIADALYSEIGDPSLDSGRIAYDVKMFLDNLQKNSVLINHNSYAQNFVKYSGEYREAAVEPEYDEKTDTYDCGGDFNLVIGGVNMVLCGDNALFAAPLHDFLDKNIADSHKLRIDFKTVDTISPYTPENAAIVVNTSELRIFSYDDKYMLRYPNSGGIARIILSIDGGYAEFYIRGEIDNYLRYDIFHALRLIFSYTAELNGLFLMHSASFEYKGKAYLFSGPSGMGKSTHTGLWKKLYPDEVSMLNGDLNLIGIEDGVPYVYGIPWNGTSGIYTNKKLPLGGITILHKAPEDRLVTLPKDEIQLSVLQRFISPFWTEAMLDRGIDFTEGLVDIIPVWQLHCTKEPSAAELMKSAIDSSLKL